MRASRNWTCVRLATYEDAGEAALLASLYRGRSGQLENTVFALLSPDGSTLLGPAGRAPRQVYGDSLTLAEALDWYARQFPNSSLSWNDDELPYVESYRLAKNIAACEGLPLLVVSSFEWERHLLKLAERVELRSAAVFVRDFERRTTLVESPGAFGIKSTPVAALEEEMSAQEIRTLLRSHWRAPKDMRSHMAEGRRRGIRWETAVPVTDPMGKY